MNEHSICRAKAVGFKELLSFDLGPNQHFSLETTQSRLSAGGLPYPQGVARLIGSEMGLLDPPAPETTVRLMEIPPVANCTSPSMGCPLYPESCQSEAL